MLPAGLLLRMQCRLFQTPWQRRMVEVQVCQLPAFLCCCHAQKQDIFCCWQHHQPHLIHAMLYQHNWPPGYCMNFYAGFAAFEIVQACLPVCRAHGYVQIRLRSCSCAPVMYLSSCSSSTGQALAALVPGLVPCAATVTILCVFTSLLNIWLDT